MANDMIRMQLQAELQMDKSIANINKQLKALSTQVDKLKISIDVDKNLAKNMTNINQSTSQATKSSVKFNETLKELIHLYKTQQISAQDFVRSASKYREVTEFTNLTQKEQIQLVTQLTKAEKEHTRVLNESHNIKKKIAKEEIASIKQQEDLVNKINLFKQRMLGSEVIKGEMDIFADKQKGKYDKTAFSLIKSDIESLSTQTPDVTNKLKELGVQWNSLRQTTMQSGSVMSRTFENMSKFLRFYLAGGILVGFVREMRNGVNSIKELDSSLVELSKVSDLTSTQLRLFTDRAYEAGKAIGRTGKEVIDATTEFKRAGYEINEAFELSQQALLLTNIGDGIKDVKEASSSLIAILKGFKMEAQDTGHIVDALNEVSNNYAVDTVNLTEIMKRASGTIAQTGTSYEELLGLATGGFESLRNAEMVASGKTFCPYVQKCA